MSMGQGADWKHSEPAGVLTHLKVATADPGAVVMDAHLMTERSMVLA